MRRRLFALVLVSAVACFALAASADDQAFGDSGGPETLEELSAMAELEQGAFVRAREKAEKIVRENPRSFVGHYVLGSVQQQAEANFPRALFELKQALDLFEQRFGATLSPGGPWRWHARLILGLAQVYNDLERYDDYLAMLARYSERYRPELIAERAWPLMKLGRMQEARTAARLAMQSDSQWQHAVALTALCAIEFEAGNDGASYDVCKRALDVARESGGNFTVELTNFAEASRSMFKLDEAEEVALEATRQGVAPFGNPWMDLAELYIREARFAEALSALKELPRYRMRRPPAVRDADRNEARRALASFFLVLGRTEDALRITERALVLPDRRAHNSRDPDQDRLVIALLDRRARLLTAETMREDAVAEPWWKRVKVYVSSLFLSFDAWRSGRVVAKIFADESKLVGAFKIGTARGAVVPPWLIGESAAVVGPGLVDAALGLASANDTRPRARGYYAAFRAEAAFERGDETEVEVQTRTALRELPESEKLLRARVHAIAGFASWDAGSTDGASRHWDDAFQSDPGVFRRLGRALPVRFEGGTHGIAEEVRDALERSPRLSDESSSPLRVRVEAQGATARACLLSANGTVLGCGDADANGAREASTPPTAESLVIAATKAFHEQVFAPRVSLSQTEANSLDGSNTLERGGLRTIFGGGDLDE